MNKFMYKIYPIIFDLFFIIWLVAGSIIILLICLFSLLFSVPGYPPTLQETFIILGPYIIITILYYMSYKRLKRIKTERTVTNKDIAVTILPVIFTIIILILWLIF